MRKLQHIVLSFCLILSLFFCPGMEVEAASVSLGVSASTVNIGDKVKVTVTVPENVSATIDLTFSANILSFSKASADVGVNGSTITLNVGKYSLAASNKLTVTFKAKTSGTASLSASVVSAVDNETAEEVDLGGASASVTVENKEAESEEKPDETPENKPEETPENKPEETPDNKPEETPENKPEETPDKTPENKPEETPDNTTPEETTPEAPKSRDNSLKKLKLSSGTLSPSFKYNVTKYTATVGYNVSSVVVSATPSNAKATIVSVTGNGTVALAVGKNKIEIVVQAENGVKATYTIIVTREAQGTEDSNLPADETDPEDTTQPELEFDWSGKKLKPAEDIPDELVPVDFSKDSIVIRNVEVPCITFANADLKALYLTNEEETAAFYVYDEVQQCIYPFVKLETNNSYIIVLLPDEANVPAPESYKPCTLSIDDKGVINAYQFMDAVDDTETTSWFAPETFYAAPAVATDFYLIYGMNSTGEKSWYVYDSVEGTFQRYLGSIQAPIVETEPDTEINTEITEDTETAEETEKYNSLLAKLEEAENMKMIIICISVFVVAVLVIIIVNLVLRGKDEEFVEDEEDDEDFDEEDDEEYDFDEDEDTKEQRDQKKEDSDVVESEDDEIEIEFYEMPQEVVEEDDEIEIEFYEMTEVSSKVETKESDEVEVEFYNMEELLLKEATASSEETSQNEKEIPTKKSTVVDDSDDDDLEFIELD